MQLKLNHFAPLIGEKFIVETNAGLLELELNEAAELPRGNRPEQFRTPLSLIFTGPPQWKLQQDNYWVSHPMIGRQVWSLVPVLADLSDTAPATVLHYQALFN